MTPRKQDAVHAWLRGRLAQAIAREPRLAAISAAHGPPRIADVGCGLGRWLEHFSRVFEDASVYGVDRDPDRVIAAHARVPCACLALADARELPWADESFDLVTQFVVFSSVLELRKRKAIAGEMLRVLKPGGLILWYDFFAPNPYNSRTHPIRRAEIGTLFPNCRITLRRVTLAAPLARSALYVSERLARELDRLPLLRTHYLATIERDSVEQEERSRESTLLSSGDRRG